MGVIGAGSWAVASHLPNLAERSDEVEFVGVARKGRRELEKIQADWGFGVASEDYTDVLEAGIDVCVVASPAGLHYEHARAALEAGAHVLVEKPMTTSAFEAWELVELAERKVLHLLLSFGWNYRPMVRRAKQLVEASGIGEPEHLMVHMASAVRELLSDGSGYPGSAPEATPEKSTWMDPNLSGGGYAQAQLSTALGLALWLVELRGAEVFAFTSSPHGAPVELHDAVSVRFDSGAVGTVSGGSCHLGSNGNRHQLEVRAIGSEGQFHIDLEREIASLYRDPEADTRLDLEPGDGVYDCVGPPNTLVDLALGRDVENCSPGELGARGVEIVEAVYRSARSGHPEPVTSRQRQPEP